MNRDDELIAQYIEEPSYSPAPTEARLKDYGTAVWALIGYLKHAVGGNAKQAAADYDVPVAAVEAALAYYSRHRRAIDARILVNAI